MRKVEHEHERFLLTLWQALRSEDKALLERCLAVSSPDIIANTVSRLQVRPSGPPTAGAR